VRIEGTQTERKVAFGLGPIAPNPFVDGTSVKFSMARSAAVTLSIYNVNGQLVRTLVDGEMSAGEHQMTWDGSDMAGHEAARGVYFCRMATEDFTATTKVLRMQ
ncbi:MAG: FlgD immunoglobulin-like domain containing protein, partial [Candidatus Eisenbacteria bacterium]